jgi:hypothetical protein
MLLLETLKLKAYTERIYSTTAVFMEMWIQPITNINSVDVVAFAYSAASWVIWIV